MEKLRRELGRTFAQRWYSSAVLTDAICLAVLGASMIVWWCLVDYIMKDEAVGVNYRFVTVGSESDRCQVY